MRALVEKENRNNLILRISIMAAFRIVKHSLTFLSLILAPLDDAVRHMFKAKRTRMFCTSERNLVFTSF